MLNKVINFAYYKHSVDKPAIILNDNGYVCQQYIDNPDWPFDKSEMQISWQKVIVAIDT